MTWLNVDEEAVLRGVGTDCGCKDDGKKYHDAVEPGTWEIAEGPGDVLDGAEEMAGIVFTGVTPGDQKVTIRFSVDDTGDRADEAPVSATVSYRIWAAKLVLSTTDSASTPKEVSQTGETATAAITDSLNASDSFAFPAGGGSGLSDNASFSKNSKGTWTYVLIPRAPTGEETTTGGSISTRVRYRETGRIRATASDTDPEICSNGSSMDVHLAPEGIGFSFHIDMSLGDGATAASATAARRWSELIGNSTLRKAKQQSDDKGAWIDTVDLDDDVTKTFHWVPSQPQSNGIEHCTLLLEGQAKGERETTGVGCLAEVAADFVEVEYSIVAKPTFNPPAQYTDYYDEGFPNGPSNWDEPGNECDD